MPTPNKKSEEKKVIGSFPATLPATISARFESKKQLLDFIASAAEGIVVQTSEGVWLFLKI